MLSCHFGSEEGLFAAIAQEAENRPRRLLASSFGIEGLDLADLARRTWRQLRAPELAP